MRKVFLLLLLCCLFMVFPALAEGAGEPEQAEWTVLLYYCGSDLESEHGFASEDLLEIRECYSAQKELKETALIFDPDGSQAALPEKGRVNVAVQTGGSKKWNSEKTGLPIRASALQRWSFSFPSDRLFGDFRLEQELPLQSMADPETLKDFIRWGKKAFPAKKYALVLWGHGDGAKTGIFVDELFQNDVMRLDELGQALTDGGVFFEAVILDACMMANIETASVLRNSAAWMIASEEMVPGRGTAVGNWLQELFNHPAQDGKQLGRNICDMTMIYYANAADEQAKSILTWSVIDLSRIERLNEAMEKFFAFIHIAYKDYPRFLYDFADYIYFSESYGDANQSMRDLSSIFYRAPCIPSMDSDLRGEIISALSDAVVYCVRGPGRSGARGLSFCYATSFSNEELDGYAHNCMSSRYLAFLDAISPWTAPEQVYEGVERLPEISTLSDYEITIEKKISVQGIPGIQVSELHSFGGMNYCLYRLDARTKQAVRLGRTVCRAYFPDENNILYSAVEPWLWPSIDGEPCDIELVSASATEALYSVPIQIGGDVWNLRYGREYSKLLSDMPESAGESHLSQYTVYGLWEGYDDDSVMLCRNVKALSQMAGQEYRLLYPVSGMDTPGKTKYIAGGQHTLYRSLIMEAVPLPAGTYCMEYEIMDMFMRPIRLERIEMYWDGEKLTFPEDLSWEGTMNLTWQ